MNFASAAVAVIVVFVALIWLAQRPTDLLPVGRSAVAPRRRSRGRRVGRVRHLRRAAARRVVSRRNRTFTTPHRRGVQWKRRQPSVSCTVGGRASPARPASPPHGLSWLRREPWCSNRAWTRRRCSSSARISPQPARCRRFTHRVFRRVARIRCCPPPFLEHTPAALILKSPFTSLADIGRYHYPLLPVDWFLGIGSRRLTTPPEFNAQCS